MKLSFRDIEPFVKNPNPAARVILVYGPDAGLVKERAETMGRTVVDDLNDPFNVAALSAEILADDPARLADEAGAISMMGGDRLIRVTGAADKLTVLIKSYLENPSNNALVILQAGALATRSSLRKLCEKLPNAAAVPCYVEDERDLSRLIRDTFHGENMNAAPDAIAYLAGAISGDRAKARRELEKVILYKGGEDTPLTLAEAQDCCGEAGATSIDDLIYSVAGGQSEKALKTYRKLMGEDVNFIVILRSLQAHFRKLHLTRARIEEGARTDQAVGALRPPLFFKHKGAFTAQVNRWSLQGLTRILEKLAALEAQCKTTGAPTETLCGQAILGISKARG